MTVAAGDGVFRTTRHAGGCTGRQLSASKGLLEAAICGSCKMRTQSAIKSTAGRLFFLDLGGGRIFSANPDGSDLKVIVNEGRKLPDGVVVDVAADHIYWTNMGNPSANDGSIERSDLDGGNITTIIPPGGTFNRSSSNSTRRTVNSIGAIAKACESCVQTSMAQISKRSCKLATGKPTGVMPEDGA
jgi:hypothetical protein